MGNQSDNDRKPPNRQSADKSGEHRRPANRDERLAAALRENLRRRKNQARVRAKPPRE